MGLKKNTKNKSKTYNYDMSLININVTTGKIIMNLSRGYYTSYDPKTNKTTKIEVTLMLMDEHLPLFSSWVSGGKESKVLAPTHINFSTLSAVMSRGLGSLLHTMAKAHC